MNKRTAVCMALLMAFGAQPSSAHHVSGHNQNPSPPAVLGPTDIIHFEAGSLVIPMDACYQRPSFMSSTDLAQILSSVTPTTTTAAAVCNDNSDKDDGLIPSYTLIFRLVKAGIPVHWAIKSGKTGWHDIDFSIVKATKGPVTHRHPGASETNRYSAITTVRYRGAPFVIDAAHATEALALIDSVSGMCNTSACYSEIDIHVAQVSFDAPIYKTIEELPKLAVVDLGTNVTSPQTDKLSASIDEAIMADLEGDVFDWVTFDQVRANGLVSGDYDIAWVPPFELGATPTAAQQDFFDNLASYTDAGGSILLQDGAIGAAEGWGTYAGSFARSGASVQDFMTDGAGVVANGASAAWDNGNDAEITRGQDYSDPPSQFGGIVWTGIGGSKYNWKPRYDFAYDPGVRRMIYTDHTTDSSKDNWDLAAWRKKDNDNDKGTIYYLGGYNWRRVTASGFRILMNTLLATQANSLGDVIELARSAPIIALVDGVETQYQGTFETQFPPETATTYASTADDETFEFPGTLGHMRAIDLAQLAEGSTTFEDAEASPGVVLFDAADGIPAINHSGAGCSFPADGTCRRIFTDGGTEGDPTELMVTTGNVSTLQPMLGPTLTTGEASTVISRIHAGRYEGGDWVARLGGVDRSTVAVIEASPLIPNGRPTMLYFGGTDGMLHAVCAEAGGGCPRAGVELWAFLPSSEMSKVVTNTARIDGSPKVADVFGDFDGVKAMRTVMVFQTGNRLPSATYAIDITDPASPDLLWKVTTPGPGVGVAIGWVRESSSIEPRAFIQTANDPSATAGTEIRSVNATTGEVDWVQTTPYTYPDARDSDNPPVPTTAIPGGVTVVPDNGSQVAEFLLVPTIYGQVFKLRADDGTNAYGSSPLFDFDSDFHPIGASVALYRGNDDLVLRALIVSGGFADPFAPSGTEWAPDDVNQYAVGFPVAPEGDDVPVTRAEVASDDTLGIHIDFGAGQRAFSPAVVAGNEVFITTDSENVNSTDYGSSSDSGRLWRQGLSGGSASYVVIPSGAASVDVSISTGAVMSGGGNAIQRTNPPGFDPIGSSTELIPETSTSRRIWLRLR